MSGILQEAICPRIYLVNRPYLLIAISDVQLKMANPSVTKIIFPTVAHSHSQKRFHVTIAIMARSYNGCFGGGASAKALDASLLVQ